MVRTHAVTLALALLLQRAAAQNCILSLDTVEGRELAVTDFSVPREYILCPNNEYMVGTLDFMNNIENGTGELTLLLCVLFSVHRTRH